MSKFNASLHPRSVLGRFIVSGGKKKKRKSALGRVIGFSIRSIKGLGKLRK